MALAPFLTLLLLKTIHAETTVSSKFSALQGCSSNAIFLGGIAVNVTGRSVLKCATQCGENAACLSFNYCTPPGYTTTTVLCQLVTSASASTCSNLTVAQGCRYLKKAMATPSCVNGVWNGATSTCVCHPGYAGTACERLIRDCSEGMALGMAGQVYNQPIQPLGAPRSFTVLCNFDYGLTGVLKRKPPGDCTDTLGLATLTWAQAKLQKGDCNCDCFAGLENIYYLLKQGTYKAKVNMKINAGADSPNRYYNSFRMDNESTSFAFTFTSSSSSTTPVADDGFPGKQGAFFTLDHDPKGCANAVGYAGLFNTTSCTPVKGFESSPSWSIAGVYQPVELFMLEMALVSYNP